MPRLPFATGVVASAVLAMGLALPATASVIPVGAGYEVSYGIDMTPGTSNGSNVGSVFIFEWDGSSHLNVDSGFTIAGTGTSVLRHVVPFAPTSSLIFGVGLGVPGVGDGKDHIYAVVNEAFAEDAVGLRWSQVFPGESDATRIRHDQFVTLLQQAAAGDAAAIATVSHFALTDAEDGAFDPAGNFRVLEATIFGPPVGVPVPEPATLALFGLGALAAAWSRAKRA
jgi:hypothetical protein